MYRIPWGINLLHDPTAGTCQGGLEVALAFGGFGGFNLAVQAVFVDVAFDGFEDAEGSGEVRVVELGKERCVEGIIVLGIVDEQVVFGDAIFPDGDDFGVDAVEADAAVLFLAENKGLPFLEVEDLIVPDAAAVDAFPYVFIKDDAVLEDLDEAGAFVGLGGLEGFDHVLGVGVDGAGEECGFCTECELHGVDRVVEGAHGGGLGLHPDTGGGAVLAFGEAVDAVVEEEDIDVEVTAENVEEVVPADAEAIPVPGNHPDGEVGVGDFDASSHCGRAAVDGVEAVGFHVIGETAGASDPAEDNELLLWDAEVRKGFLDGVEDGVIPASGAPADVVLGDEILFGKGGWGFEGFLAHGLVGRSVDCGFWI